MQQWASLQSRSYQVIEHLESYFRAVFAVTVLTVVQNVRDFMVIVVVITTLNWLAGYIADVKRGKKYQHRKTMQAVRELLVTVLILFFTAFTCTLLEPSIDYKIIIKTLTGIFVIIYARNITRNLRIIQPSNEFVKVLNAIAAAKYLKLKKTVKEGEFEIPKEEKQE